MNIQQIRTSGESEASYLRDRSWTKIFVGSTAGDGRAAGVDIKTGIPVESLDALLEGGCDAILVAVGTHRSRKLSIPGIDNEGVFCCVDFLRDVSLCKSVDPGKRVVVLGGGKAAFDCARVPRKLGAEEVHSACVESRTEMPAGGL